MLCFHQGLIWDGIYSIGRINFATLLQCDVLMTIFFISVALLPKVTRKTVGKWKSIFILIRFMHKKINEELDLIERRFHCGSTVMPLSLHIPQHFHQCLSSCNELARKGVYFVYQDELMLSKSGTPPKFLSFFSVQWSPSWTIHPVIKRPIKWEGRKCKQDSI